MKYSYNLKHLTWFKVGGDADIFFKPGDKQELIRFLKENKGQKTVTVIGAGSNLIIRDKGIEGIVLKLGRNFTDISLTENNEIAVGAGCLNFNLAEFCRINSISGFEFLVGIPGTIGGGIAMNAGAYGREFKDIARSVEALDNQGNVINLDLKDICFSYRSNALPKDLIFTEVLFKIEKSASSEEIKSLMNEIKEKRKTTQPITEKTGGSIFANPQGYKAWELIDQSGMRGAKIGEAAISDLHCNFMINLGNARASDLEDLGELIIKEVKKKSGVELTWEIKRVGRI